MSGEPKNDNKNLIALGMGAMVIVALVIAYFVFKPDPPPGAGNGNEIGPDKPASGDPFVECMRLAVNERIEQDKKSSGKLSASEKMGAELTQSADLENHATWKRIKENDAATAVAIVNACVEKDKANQGWRQLEVSVVVRDTEASDRAIEGADVSISGTGIAGDSRKSDASGNAKILTARYSKDAQSFDLSVRHEASGRQKHRTFTADDANAGSLKVYLGERRPRLIVRVADLPSMLEGQPLRVQVEPTWADGQSGTIECAEGSDPGPTCEQVTGQKATFLRQGTLVAIGVRVNGEALVVEPRSYTNDTEEVVVSWARKVGRGGGGSGGDAAASPCFDKNVERAVKAKLDAAAWIKQPAGNKITVSGNAGDDGVVTVNLSGGGDKGLSKIGGVSVTSGCKAGAYSFSYQYQP